ncbi:MAG: hypothetical protein MJA30_22005, partial [Cytophagales bacterium]|nr:hypothetical protein [Cytophagales bacterium]
NQFPKWQEGRWLSSRKALEEAAASEEVTCFSSEVAEAKEGSRTWNTCSYICDQTDDKCVAEVV